MITNYILATHQNTKVFSELAVSRSALKNKILNAASFLVDTKSTVT
jgi:hypothetical protein